MDEELRGTVEPNEGFELSNEEPVAVNEEPVVINEEPVAVNEEPVVINEEPVAVNEEPVVINEEPMVVSEEPMTVSEQPVVAYYEPMVEQAESVPMMPETVIPPVMETSGTGRQEVWRHEPDSPYSPLYVPDRKQANKNKLTIGMIILLIIALLVCLVIAIAKVVDTAMEEASSGIASWKETYNEFVENLEEEPEERNEYSDDWSDWEVMPEPNEGVLPDDFNWEDYEEYDEYDEYDDYYDYEEYVPSPEDEYYVEIVDSIRDDLSYSVEKEEYVYEDIDTTVSVYVEYVVVDGENLVFKDKINEALENGAMYFTKELASESATDLTIYVESYVTYMDEDILSVVVNEQYYWGYDGVVNLYCMNFDVKTGALLYNTEIIDATEELAAEFRDMSDYQNGTIDHLDEISDEDICEYMSDEDYLILFYTPVGLEVGFNYYEGWVTATIKEYEKYLRKL